MEERYSRQIELPEIGVEGQKRLERGRVLIVGAGGLGSAVALYLAAAGVGTLIVADNDSVSLSNLQRQILYDTSEIGRMKAECACKRLHGLNPEITLLMEEDGLTPANAHSLIGSADIVVDCCDNFTTRILANKVCKELGRPWIFGAVEGFTGLIAFFDSKKNKQLEDLFPDLGEEASLKGNPVGIIGATAGVVGSLQALECIKFLTGLPYLQEGKLLLLDLRTISFKTISF